MPRVNREAVFANIRAVAFGIYRCMLYQDLHGSVWAGARLRACIA
jgi:hypothetical protein